MICIEDPLLGSLGVVATVAGASVSWNKDYDYLYGAGCTAFTPGGMLDQSRPPYTVVNSVTLHVRLGKQSVTRSLFLCTILRVCMQM